MSRLRIGSAALLAALVASIPAFGDSYPVTGHWTYNYSADQGPAKECGDRTMEFEGERRLTNVGGAPDYRNISITAEGASSYRISDQIYTGQVQGHVDYTLRLIDNDHIQLQLDSGGTIMLRRCGA